MLANHGYDLINFRIALINQIANYLPKTVIDQIADKDNHSKDFSKKSRFFLSDEIGIKRADLPLPVRCICFVQINQSEQITFTQISTSETIEKLVGEFFLPLRGLGSFLINNSGEITSPSVVMRPLTGWNMGNIINNLAKQCPAYFLSSNLDTAIQLISRINL